MKLEKLSAGAEIVSSIAILVTLGYLAIQTQQNTAAIQATVRQAMLSEDVQSLYRIVDLPFLSGDTSYLPLTREQEIQTRAYMTAFLRMRENHWLQYQSGVLDESTWETYRRALGPVVFSSETGRSLWQRSLESGTYSQGFRDSINEMLAEDLPNDGDCVRGAAIDC